MWVTRFFKEVASLGHCKFFLLLQYVHSSIMNRVAKVSGFPEEGFQVGFIQTDS
jgi:hypothetical protein